MASAIHVTDQKYQKDGEGNMDNRKIEERGVVLDNRTRLIQQGIKYGMVVALGGGILCMLIIIPVMWAFLIPESSAGSGIVSLPIILAGLLVPFAGMGILGMGLYKLIPLYIQYRHEQEADEDMFP